MASKEPHRLIVVGASAGGVSALVQFVGGLSPTLPAAVLVVLHVPANARSVLPEILDRAGPLPAAHPRDREPIVAGQIYVAPPNRHLVVDEAVIRVTNGPWENGHRPSIDVLFRSTALWYGTRAIGALLSGALSDGAAGLASLASRGAVTFVQDPEEAEVPDMPRHALESTPTAHALPITGIVEQINRLARQPVPVASPVDDSVARAELDVETGHPRRPERIGTPAGLGCPNCGGSLFEVDDASALRYRCRVGHGWTADGFANAHAEELEEALWVAIRILEDDEALQERLAQRAAGAGFANALERATTRQEGHRRLIRSLRTAVNHLGDGEDEVIEEALPENGNGAAQQSATEQHAHGT